MKTTIVILALSLFILFPEISVSQSDTKEGPKSFKGIKWGTEIADLPEMIHWGHNKNNKNVKWYTRKNDKMKIGGARVKNIFYVFFKGRFYKGQIGFMGKSNYDKLYKIFEAVYGQPTVSIALFNLGPSYGPDGEEIPEEPKPKMPKKTWPFWKLKVRLNLDYEDCFSKWFCKGYALYIYTPIAIQVQKETENKQKETEYKQLNKQLKAIDKLKKDLE